MKKKKEKVKFLQFCKVSMYGKPDMCAGLGFVFVLFDD